MVKKVFLDIETTGLSLINGDRIIEICCIESYKNNLIGNIFHSYLNPMGKLISEDAYKIHGIKNLFLKNKPDFKKICNRFLKFIAFSELIIHNASFDLSFINFELKLLGFKEVSFYCIKITDSLLVARKIFPGKRNSLDFLAKRFVLGDSRKIHGAFVDVKLLFKIYFFLTRRLKPLKIFKNIFKTSNINRISDNNIILKLSRKNLIRHNQFFKNVLNFKN